MLPIAPPTGGLASTLSHQFIFDLRRLFHVLFLYRSGLLLQPTWDTSMKTIDTSPVLYVGIVDNVSEISRVTVRSMSLMTKRITLKITSDSPRIANPSLRVVVTVAQGR